VLQIRVFHSYLVTTRGHGASGKSFHSCFVATTGCGASGRVVHT